VPEWLGLLVLTAATCGLVLLLAVLRHRRGTGKDDPSETPDVIEYLTMMLGVVYAIVLGLAIAGVWEARGEAGQYARQEAQALHEMDQRAAVFPAEVREDIRGRIRDYVGHVVDVEWPHMADQGELTDRGDRLLGDLRTAVIAREPQTVREVESYQGLLDQAALVDEARAGRGDSAEGTLPGLVWFGLITGAVVAVGMVFFLQIQRSARELILAGLFSALLAFLLFLVWHFDAPYAHGLADADEVFTAYFPAADPTG